MALQIGVNGTEQLVVDGLKSSRRTISSLVQRPDNYSDIACSVQQFAWHICIVETLLHELNFKVAQSSI